MREQHKTVVGPLAHDARDGKMCAWIWVTCWILILLVVSAAGAAADPLPSPSPSASPLSEDAADISPDFNAPLIPSLWVSLEDEFSPNYEDLSKSSNQINLRGQIPLGNFGQQLPGLLVPGHLQLIKFKIPFVTEAPGNAFKGNGDTTLTALQYLGRSDHKWVIGPVFKLPTASADDLGSGKWSIGPAVGLTNQHGRTVIGFFTQSYFSFAGPKSRPNVSQTQFQPGLYFIFRNGWILGTSQMQFTYNWENNQWPSVPLGVRIAHNFENSSGQLAAGFEAEKNLVSVQGTPAWTLRLNFKYRFNRKKQS